MLLCKTALCRLGLQRQLLLQRAQSCRFREAADYRQRRRTYCQSRHRGVVKENRRLIVEQRVLTPDSILPVPAVTLTELKHPQKKIQKDKTRGK